MIFLSMVDALNKVAEIVNKCLGPLGSMDFSWTDIRDVIIQLCSTLIIFIFVRIFLWKRITNLIEKKRESIDSKLTEANEAKEKALSLEKKLEEEYEKSKIEVRKIIANAIKDANLKREEIINEAKEEAERRIKNSQEEINKEISKAKEDIRKQIIDVAFAAANKIVSREINPDKYLDIVDEIIKEAK